jgi:hypothetical protein
VNLNYNGWANYDTWNVALWLRNDESLYKGMLEYLEGNYPIYEDLIQHLDLEESMTPDKVAWLSPNLDVTELNEMLEEEKTESRVWK